MDLSQDAQHYFELLDIAEYFVAHLVNSDVNITVKSLL